MTLKEFFRKARRGRKWEVTTNSAGASVVRCADGYCPLGAVLNDGCLLPGRVHAADALRLPVRYAYRIAAGADRDNSEDRPWLLKNLGIAP